MKVFNVLLLLVAAAVESITALSEVDCSKPPLTGPCRGFFTRYYYNPKTGRCETFLYGGCRGNKNNFQSEDECYQQCGVKCGSNAHFESCGTDCPLTCDNYDNPPEICNLSCRIGCQCDKGYVQTKDGRCVKPKDCPVKRSVKCGENAHYDQCGSLCPLTCGNYHNPPKACAAVCVEGCHCDEGFVSTKNGRCVKPEECPVTRHANCRKNEEFVECGTACPLTCDNYDNPPEFCVALCVIGCQCKDGFVRSQGGRCVRPEQCPKIPPLPRHDIRTECPPNKEYGSFGDCPDSCYSLEHPVRACTLKLNYGCKCMPGYVLKEDKDFDSDCIKPEECPSDVWG